MFLNALDYQCLQSRYVVLMAENNSKAQESTEAMSRLLRMCNDGNKDFSYWRKGEAIELCKN